MADTADLIARIFGLKGTSKGGNLTGYPRFGPALDVKKERDQLETLVLQYWALKKWTENENVKQAQGSEPSQPPYPEVIDFAVETLRERLFGFLGFENTWSLTDPLRKAADAALIDMGRDWTRRLVDKTTLSDLQSVPTMPWNPGQRTRIPISVDEQMAIKDLPSDPNALPDIGGILMSSDEQSRVDTLAGWDEPPDMQSSYLAGPTVSAMRKLGYLPPPSVFWAFERDPELKSLMDDLSTVAGTTLIDGYDEKENSMRLAMRSGNVAKLKKILTDITAPVRETRRLQEELKATDPGGDINIGGDSKAAPLPSAKAPTYPPTWPFIFGMSIVPKHVKELPGPLPWRYASMPNASGDYDKETNEMRLTDPLRPPADRVDLVPYSIVAPPHKMGRPSLVPVHEFAHRLDATTGNGPGGWRSNTELLRSLFRRYCSHFGPYACQNPTEFFAEVMSAYWLATSPGNKQNLDQLAGLFPDLYEYARNIDNDIRRRAGRPELDRYISHNTFGPQLTRFQNTARYPLPYGPVTRNENLPAYPAERFYPPLPLRRTIGDRMKAMGLNPPDSTLQNLSMSEDESNNIDELIGSDLDFDPEGQLTPKDRMSAGYRAAVRAAINAGDLEKASRLNDEWYQATGT